MSYADAAAKGPKQSPEEVSVSSSPSVVLRARRWICVVLPALRGVYHNANNNIALPSFNHTASHQSSSNAKLTKHSRAPAPPVIEHTEATSTSSLIDVDSPHVSSVPSDFDTQSIKTDTQEKRIELEAQAKEAAAHAQAAKERAKARAKKDAGIAKANAGNPVVIGNVVAVGVLGTVLGVGAYRKWGAGELSWKVAGTWAGVVGLFAVGDYYVSQYFFQKYPPKK